MRVLFLLPVRGQPRYQKRIRALMRLGVIVEAAYFDRPYFSGSPLPCASTNLGDVRHGRYLRRLLAMLRSKHVIARKSQRFDVIYAFGLDMAVLARLAAGRSHVLVYEVGDIRPIQVRKGFVGGLVRCLERWVVKGVSEIVVTAQGFARGYFVPRLGVDPGRIRTIENRLELPRVGWTVSEGRRDREILGNREIVIGYFGVLRCQRSWELLNELTTAARGQIRVLARGYPIGIDIEQMIHGNQNMQLGGQFIAPNDLPEMYRMVDLVWGCYPYPKSHDEQNWKWARTNRFYESCYFRRPVLSLKGTDEAREVEALGIGTSVDLADPRCSALKLLDLIPRALPSWQAACDSLPDSIGIYSTEHESLVQTLGDLVKKTRLAVDQSGTDRA